MRKQNRQFIILAVVLIVLVGGYIGLTQYNSRQQEQEADQSEKEVLVDISRDDILRFSYEYNGEAYAFEKKETAVDIQGEGISDEAEETQVESRWVYTEDETLNLMQSRLNTMAGKLTNIVAVNLISDVTDMSQYGLEEPANVLHWETEYGSYTYNVGDYNSIASVYYICEPGSDTVYTVSASLGTGFDYSLEDLIEEETDTSAETQTE
ncbi:MAG: DUF4340 domain-containing protein [Acetatifactor sp.]|nr:DUF4340 domain-containing protein [Acetatifactor sp.]